MWRQIFPVCLLAAELLRAPANAQQGERANSTAHAAEKNSAERVYESAASKVVFLLMRKSGELHARASGTVLSADGYIATNYHALQGADAVEIRFFPDPKDSEDYQSFNGAKLLYADSERDIAVLRVNTKTLALPDWPSITRCEPRVGETVYAIGNPKGLSNTISQGIVSALRSANGEGVVQHTAAISPGSSGGALLDSSGCLLGMNSWQIEDGQSLNFAISANHLLEALSFARRSTGSLPFPPEIPSGHGQEIVNGSWGPSQSAVNSLHRIATAIKQCPRATLPEQKWGKGPKEIWQIIGGPPENVVWDVESSNSARSPYSGYIQFIVRWQVWVPPESFEKFTRKMPGYWESFQQDFKPIEYRYEFDVGPDGLELVRVFSRRENETDWKADQLPGWCWGQVVPSQAAQGVKP